MNKDFPDPFEVKKPQAWNAAAADVLAQASRNARAIEILSHEATAAVLDEPEEIRRAIKQDGERDYRDARADKRSREQRVAETLSNRRARSASLPWSDLDRLAMRRAAAWIVMADGYGQGVTEDECEFLVRDLTENVPAVARQIIRRLAEIVPAPDVDAEILTASDALSGIRPAEPSAA